MNHILIQIINIQVYSLTSFPEQRIKELISELNVHYGKINSYIKADVAQERINIELIDSLSKLQEINRITPHKINSHSISGDFRLGIDILESVISLLQIQAGHESTREGLLNLGWSLLGKLYEYSYSRLTFDAFLFNWLKQQGLTSSNSMLSYSNYHERQDDKRIKFSPSIEEMDSFYNENRKRIYQIMVYEMDHDRSPPDPFQNNNAVNFYHYHQILSNIRK